jgi:hypothetical protein
LGSGATDLVMEVMEDRGFGGVEVGIETSRIQSEYVGMPSLVCDKDNNLWAHVGNTGLHNAGIPRKFLNSFCQ